jgi:hypothetical protein
MTNSVVSETSLLSLAFLGIMPSGSAKPSFSILVDGSVKPSLSVLVVVFWRSLSVAVV